METRLASTAAGLCHGTPPIKKSRAAEELRNLVEEHWPWLLPKLEPQTLRADRSPPLRFEALARLTPTSGYGLGKFCGYVAIRFVFVVGEDQILISQAGNH